LLQYAMLSMPSGTVPPFSRTVARESEQTTSMPAS
jgi:hypothetical protein